MLGGNPGTPQNPGFPGTSLLYAGEQFDTDMQQYYLRARYYDQNTGRFNRMDPFAGNRQDPQSLHKYLYCHANPLNGVDPTGCLSSFAQVLVGVGIGMLIGGIICIIAGIVFKSDTIRDLGLIAALGGLTLIVGGFMWSVGGALAAFGAEQIATTLGTSTLSAIITIAGGLVLEFEQRVATSVDFYRLYESGVFLETGLKRRMPPKGTVIIRRFLRMGMTVPDFSTKESPPYEPGDKVLQYDSTIEEGKVMLYIYKVDRRGRLDKKFEATHTLPVKREQIFDDKLGSGWTVLESEPEPNY